MSPNASAELSSALDRDHQSVSIDDRLADGGILGALIEALNAPELYQIIQRGGEFFIESALEG